jgi:AcrR family transcriptional regulator
MGQAATPSSATPSKVGTPKPRRVRKSPDTRRHELVNAAVAVFAETGYQDTGFADVAAAAKVSKALLYHYFPHGRPELFVQVTQAVLADFIERLHNAAKAPFSASTRMEHLLGALFAFFDDNPQAYRILFRDPWVAQDEKVEAAAIATRVQLAAEMASVMARSGLPPDELLVASTGLLGFALANVELCLADQVDAETAWQITCRYAVGQLPD